MADAAVDTAPNDENDDSWLYGDSNNDQAENKPEESLEVAQKATEVSEKTGEGEEKETNEENIEDPNFNDEHFAEVSHEEQDQDQEEKDGDSQENGDSDSDDSDDVKVTIGEIKSGSQYASLNIKRGVGLVPNSSDKPKSGPVTGSKVTLEDLEGPGSINGVPALEFNIDTIEDKPWNKPGADISDYFNYGFNEVTWSAYCERQRRMRVNEAGVGLHVGPPPRMVPPDVRRGQIRNDENGPPSGANSYQNRENTIQVMTAERREYGRSGARDAPPEYYAPPPTDHYYPPPAAYDEPAWGQPEQNWAPNEIKELTPGPGPMGPPTMAPPIGMPTMPPHMPHVMPYMPPYRAPPPHHIERERERDRERDRDRDRERDRIREREDRERREREREFERERDRDRERSRSIKPDRVREKSYRRDRSRSRSRRHKSRSRSPRLRERSRDRSRERDRSVKKSKEVKEKDEQK